MYKHCVDLLRSRGVSLQDIAEVVHEVQQPYNKKLKLSECIDSVSVVLWKREVQHAIITGIYIDILAEEKKLPSVLQQLIDQDAPLYGIDEVLALSITNVYGSIALTCFGYLDKMKMGILKHLDEHDERVHVFLDDIVAAIAAAASSRLGHRNMDLTAVIDC